MNCYREAFKLKGTPVRVEFRSEDNPFAGRRNKRRHDSGAPRCGTSGANSPDSGFLAEDARAQATTLEPHVDLAAGRRTRGIPQDFAGRRRS